MFMWLRLSDADAETKIAGSLRGYGAIEGWG
jgi:hypothetical protein